MDIQITFTSLIYNKHWRRIQMCLMFVILAAQPNYSYHVPQTFSGSNPAIVTQYDRDKNETAVATGTVLEERHIDSFWGTSRNTSSLNVGYLHKGLQPDSPPSTVTMVFRSQAKRLRFGEGVELLSIIDDDRVALGQMSYISNDPLVGGLAIIIWGVQDEYLRVVVP